jgi:hypothetical protein
MTLERSSSRIDLRVLEEQITIGESWDDPTKNRRGRRGLRSGRKLPQGVRAT